MGSPPMGGPMGGSPVPMPSPAPYGGLGPSPFAPPPAGGNPMQQQPPPGGSPSPEFLYGGAPPQYGLTGAQPAQDPMPPDPYAQGPGMGGGMPGGGPIMSGASRATLSGSAGTYTVVPGFEMLAGRDASRCQIVLSEPRVSGVHARVKLENGQLFVLDEQSNNGTFVDNQRLAPQTWMLAGHGSVVRFGPVDFSVRLE